jgi:hypothetical protein
MHIEMSIHVLHPQRLQTLDIRMNFFPILHIPKRCAFLLTNHLIGSGMTYKVMMLEMYIPSMLWY